MATPATAPFSWMPESIQRQAGAAHRSHRRRSVRLQNVGHDADRVRRLVRARQNRGNRALRQRSVAHFAPAHAGHTSRFTNAERRKVVVQHEVFLLLAFIALQPLRVVHGAQRRRHQRLRFAARKQRRSVRPGQHAGLDRDGTNLVERAAIGPDALLRHLLAEHPLAQMLVIRSPASSWRPDRRREAPPPAHP